MPIVNQYWRSATLVVLALVFAATSSGQDAPAAKQRPLRLALFPFVPNQKLIQDVVTSGVCR